MPQYGNIAITGKTPAGANQALGLDASGALIGDNLHGERYLQAHAGNIFMGANPSGVTTSVALATTYVGLCLSNPAANTKNLAVLRLSGAFIVAPATITTVGLITGFAAGGVTVHTTPLTPQSALVGSSAIAATGKLDSACTLVGTPVWSQWVAQAATATTAPFWSLDIAGAIVIPPGGYLAIGTTIAGPSSGFQAAVSWEEVAV